ncbi:four-carbon acid sugar kinase family protein [Streptomyces sp. NPDC127114]|uniref:four-carbon acid sugar kinase family protein n=1 Tax=Streptomyces sp. NPDC127114 TaxID=3345366 RepID=UPI00363C11AD
MPPATVAVLADDLTSAADGAAPFRRTGHRAVVLCEPLAGPTAGPTAGPLAGPTAGPLAAPPGEGVTAVDLGTRLVDAAEAAARTRRAAGAYAGADLLIKTVDSTLRGHVAAELRAALAGSGRRAAIVAPAFPAEGRTTVDGVQYVRGVRVDESEFARDPAHPVRTSDLARILPEAVLVGAEELPGAVAKGGVLVCSAVSDAELDAIVAAVPTPEQVLWVGSPGLADALARRHPRGQAAAPPELPPVRSPLTVVGSANPASRRQLAALRARFTDPVAVLHTPEERGTDPAALLARLVEEVRRAVAEGRADGLVLTGGETAAAVLGALGADGIELYDEPEPGIARGTLHAPAAPAASAGGSATPAPLPAPVPVLVKAGGFGDDDALVRLHALLTAGGSR